MLYREIIAVCSQIHTKHVNTLCGQNVEFLNTSINPLKAELNPICHLLALLGAHHIFHVSGLRVKVVVDIVSTGLRTANYSEIPVTWEKLLLVDASNDTTRVTDEGPVSGIGSRAQRGEGINRFNP